MNVDSKHFRTIWISDKTPGVVHIIDQRKLPFNFVIEDLKTADDMFTAIKDMHVRGAGLIGAAGAYGIFLAAYNSQSEDNLYDHICSAGDKLKTARPTAINLTWAIERQLQHLSKNMSPHDILETTKITAQHIADEDAQACHRIGEYGLPLIQQIAQTNPGRPVNILTHCNAGWLAFVDYGSATAPIYAAHDSGIQVHIWVDETRPRNQGSRLTAWELEQHGVPHTIIPDNTGGHLMQQGLVDLVMVGTDRTTFTGDVANKIGTYLKALAAYDNNVPFYVAAPSSSIDWHTEDGLTGIPIEVRNSDEVKYAHGLAGGTPTSVLLTPLNSSARNYAFDVTPARLVTGLITERGLCSANRESIARLFPEKQQHHG